MAVSSWTTPDSLMCHRQSLADYRTTIGRLKMWPICPTVGAHVPLLVMTGMLKYLATEYCYVAASPQPSISHSHYKLHDCFGRQKLHQCRPRNNEFSLLSLWPNSSVKMAASDGLLKTLQGKGKILQKQKLRKHSGQTSYDTLHAMTTFWIWLSLYLCHRWFHHRT